MSCLTLTSITKSRGKFNNSNICILKTVYELSKEYSDLEVFPGRMSSNHHDEDPFFYNNEMQLLAKEMDIVITYS